VTKRVGELSAAQPYLKEGGRLAHQNSKHPVGLELFLFSSLTQEELRPTSGRAGATIGASKASRTPECGTLCCRLREMELCSMWGGALLLLLPQVGLTRRGRPTLTPEGEV